MSHPLFPYFIEGIRVCPWGIQCGPYCLDANGGTNVVKHLNKFTCNAKSSFFFLICNVLVFFLLMVSHSLYKLILFFVP